MKITKVKICNFRILENITIDFDEVMTLVVGRNNSGKTSLAEVFSNFFSVGEKSKFRFEDFTLRNHKRFIKALRRYERYVKAVDDKEDIKAIEKRERLYKLTFPKIVAEIYLEYNEEDNGKLASISSFLLDLDETRKDALISCEFGVFELEKLFKTYSATGSEFGNNFIEFLRQSPPFFEKRFYSVDERNRTYRSLIDKPLEIENIFLPRFMQDLKDKKLKILHLVNVS